MSQPRRPTAENPTSIILDTDPGIDDAVAIMLAAASPEVKVLGITAVAGNTSLEYTARNAAALADLCRFECPIGVGASGPLWRRDRQSAGHVHGDDGLGGYQLPASQRPLEPAVELMRRLIEESPDPVTLVPVGPLTNVAMLMIQYPETARKLERIVMMGGGAREHIGNVTPVAEFNVYFDPDAAARVFAFGVPITMVGLNVTHAAQVGSADLATLYESGGPVADIVKVMLKYYAEMGYLVEGSDEVPQHDSLAMAAVIRPDLLTTEHVFVDVENVGRLTSGMTVIDFNHRLGQAPNCDVAVRVDSEAFIQMLVARLTQLDHDLQS